MPDSAPPERSIRLMTDYGAIWPLWGPAADALDADAISAELRRDLEGWQEFFDRSFHYEAGWSDKSAAITYVARGRNLLHRLGSALPDHFIELDLWPVDGGLVGSWKENDD